MFIGQIRENIRRQLNPAVPNSQKSHYTNLLKHFQTFVWAFTVTEKAAVGYPWSLYEVCFVYTVSGMHISCGSYV